MKIITFRESQTKPNSFRTTTTFEGQFAGLTAAVVQRPTGSTPVPAKCDSNNSPHPRGQDAEQEVAMLVPAGEMPLAPRQLPPGVQPKHYDLKAGPDILKNNENY